MDSRATHIGVQQIEPHPLISQQQSAEGHNHTEQVQGTNPANTEPHWYDLLHRLCFHSHQSGEALPTFGQTTLFRVSLPFVLQCSQHHCNSLLVVDHSAASPICFDRLCPTGPQRPSWQRLLCLVWPLKLVLVSLFRVMTEFQKSKGSDN